MKTKYIISISLFILIFESCNIDLSDTYYREIEIKEVQGPSINFFNTQDTIYVRGTKKFTFLPVDLNKKIDSVKILLNDIVLREGGYHIEIYNLSSTEFSDGFYTLKYTFHTKSNTGSLADKLDLEKQLLVYEKVIEIDNKPLPEFNIRTGIEDGVLFFKWDPYTGRFFDKYIIEMDGRWRDPIEITDPYQTKVMAPQFAGGVISCDFQLYAKNSFSSTKYSFIDTLNYKHKFENNRHHFSWSESPYKNYKAMKIVMHDGLSLYSNLFLDTIIDQNINHSFIIESRDIFPLGNMFYAYVETASGKLWNMDYFYHRIEKLPGYFHRFSDRIYLEDGNYYYINYSGMPDNHEEVLKVKNPQGEIVLMTSEGNFRVSKNAKYVISFNPGNGFIDALDPKTLTKIGEFDLFSIVGVHELRGFQISSDNKLLFVGTDPITKLEKYFVLDWDSKILLYEGILDYNYWYIGYLGKGGKYFISQKGCIDLENNIVFKNNIQLFDELDSYLHAVDNQVHIRNINNDTILKSFLFEGDVYYMFNDGFDYWGVMYRNAAFQPVAEIYSMKSQNRVLKLNINNSCMNSDTELRVWNNQLVLLYLGFSGNNIYSLYNYHLPI